MIALAVTALCSGLAIGIAMGLQVAARYRKLWQDALTRSRGRFRDLLLRKGMAEAETEAIRSLWLAERRRADRAEAEAMKW